MSPNQVKKHIHKFYLNYVDTKYRLIDWSRRIYTTEYAYPNDSSYHKYYIFYDQTKPENYYLSIPDYVFTNYEIIGDKTLNYDKLTETCALYLKCKVLYKHNAMEYDSQILLPDFLDRYDNEIISIAKESEAFKNKYVSRFLLQEYV